MRSRRTWACKDSATYSFGGWGLGPGDLGKWQGAEGYPEDKTGGEAKCGGYTTRITVLQ